MLLEISNPAAIDQICKSFYQSMSNDFVKSGMKTAQIIGGIGVFLSLYMRYEQFLWGNGKFSPNVWFKPILIAFIVGGYPNIFKGFEKTFFEIDKKSSSISLEVRNKVDTKLKAKKEALLKKEKAEQESILNNSHDSQSWYLSAYQSISDGIGVYFDELILQIARIFYYAIYCLLKITSLIYILFIGMFGSIIIALSLFKWFEGGLPTWIARLVTTLMWMPVLNIVSYAVSTIQVEMLQKDIEAINSSQTNFNEDVFGILFYIIAIGMYWQVPKISGFLMESAGVGSGGLSTFTNWAQNFGSLSSSSAGTVGGGIAGMGYSGAKATFEKGFDTLKQRFSAR